MELSSTIEQQIAELERQIKEKKQALQKEGAADVSDRELIHETVSEQFQTAIQEVGEAPDHTIHEKPLVVSGDEPSYLQPDIQPKVQELINMAFGPGDPYSAIREAAKTKNAALIDAFHDALSDEFLIRLQERNKLPVLK